MQSSPFSISTDRSSDSDSKQYPLVVRSFDPESGTVNSELLSIAIPPSATVDSIIEQFTLYQSTDLRDCENVHSHVDQWWVEIGRKHQQQQFLSQVMYGILCLPHSSAHCERIFSTVRKNKTDKRASLSEDTLDSLLVVKHQSERSKEREFKPAQIDRLKGCYYQSLNK